MLTVPPGAINSGVRRTDGRPNGPSSMALLLTADCPCHPWKLTLGALSSFAENLGSTSPKFGIYVDFCTNQTAYYT